MNILTFLKWTLFIIYLAVLTKIILIKHYPLSMFITKINSLSYSDITWHLRLQTSNFIPFKTIISYLFLADINTNIRVENIIGNIVAFAPLGFLLPILFFNLNKIKFIAMISLATSLFFETTQLIIGVGSFDIDDLILNTLGALAGYLIYKWMEYTYQNRKQAQKENEKQVIKNN